MADQKTEKKQNQAPAAGGQVLAFPTSCASEGCMKKQTRAGFCDEHFVWFKEGLINRQGEKAKDFDKKYQAFKMRRQDKAA